MGRRIARVSRYDDQRNVARSADQFRLERQIEAAVEHDPDRRALLQPWHPHRKFRIVGNGRTDTDEDRVRLGTQHLHLGARDGTGNPHLPLASPSDHAVRGNRKFQSHMRAFLALTHEVGLEHTPALFMERAYVDVNAGAAKHHHAAAGNAFIGIEDGNDDTADTRGDQRIRAGRGLAMMRAGFEGDIGGRSPRLFARLRKRLRFRVRSPARSGHGSADDRALVDDDAADRGIGGSQAEIAPCKPQRRRHETFVFTCRLAHTACSPGYSPGSRAILALISAITFSKSSAWEKSR